MFLSSIRRLNWFKIPSLYNISSIGSSIQPFRSFSNQTYQQSIVSEVANEVIVESPSQPLPRNGLKVYIKSFGCSHNMSDGEYMAGLLDYGGYEIINQKENADVWIINTCTVRDKSIYSFERYYKEAKQLNIPVIISGCMTQADKDMVKKYKKNVIVGVTQIHQIKEIVDNLFHLNSITLPKSSSSSIPPLQLPKIRKDKDIEILPISLGCNGSCTFCQTKLARGNLRSYPISEIINRIRECKQQGIKEIWLTSEDVGAYGSDCNSSISSLLEAIQEEIESTNIMIKIGMTNPPYILQNLPAIIKALNHKNFYSYLHIPVQSGSNSVLQHMNRHYSVEEFISLCTQLKQAVPGLVLTTDLIIGFPGETAVDFQASLCLLRNLNFSIVHYSKYYPRPHTVAAHYPQLPQELVNLRVKEMSDWFKQLNPYKELIGKYCVVWVSNECMEDKRCCHTKNYIKFIVDNSKEYHCGDCLLVECEDVTRFHAVGKVICSLPPLPKNIPTNQLFSNDKKLILDLFCYVCC